MIFFKTTLIITIFACVGLVHANSFRLAKSTKKRLDDSKAIYGNDDRRLDNRIHNSALEKLSLSVAAMIHIDQITKSKTKEGMSEIWSDTLAELYSVCEGQRFYDELAAADCSGFFVGKDILVTAGHCAAHNQMCEKFRWVFDYRSRRETRFNHGAMYIPTDSIYKCKEIIEISTSNEPSVPGKGDGVDYAIIKLDREVDRGALKYRRSGVINDKAKLAVIGHPSGLPTIIADNGQVTFNLFKNFFKASVDAFGGNSGSPVINLRTGVVEGILANGEEDYTFDKEKQCLKVVRHEMSIFSGEGVVRMTVLSKKLDDLLK